MSELKGIDYELVVVIDGMSDNSHSEASKVEGIKVIAYEKNQGKGFALRTGFNHSTGSIVTFIDGDGDFHPDQLINFFPYLATADLVIGSKRHPFSLVSYPLIRKILSQGFQTLSKLFLGISLRDTQSGLKLMKREVLEVVLPLLLMNRFSFDLELCFLAQKHGFRSVEAPICINFQGGSTIGPNVPLAMFKDILYIRYMYTFKKYYQQRFHEFHFRKLIQNNIAND